MTKEEAINILIKDGVDTNKISDGYHSFGELYEHRIQLHIALCYQLHLRRINGSDKILDFDQEVWRSTLHSDGSSFDGWFLLGIGKKSGNQITYHLPASMWDNTHFAETLQRSPEFDGHTPNDVLIRIKRLV